MDFNKFRTRRLNDRKMFAFYVQVKWQEISSLFVFVSLHVFVGRHKPNEITEIDPKNRTYTNLKPGKSQINYKKGSFLDRQSSETSLSLFKERNKTKYFIYGFSSTTNTHLIDWQKDKKDCTCNKRWWSKKRNKNSSVGWEMWTLFQFYLFLSNSYIYIRITISPFGTFQRRSYGCN